MNWIKRYNGSVLPHGFLALALLIATIAPVAVHSSSYQDDAFISFVYARNLARGAGLVYNAGEPAVEGYTNFLWIMMLGLGMRVGLDPDSLSLVFGIASGLGVVVLSFALAVRLGATRLFAGLASLFMATRPTLIKEASGGLETPLFTLLLTAGVLLWLRERAPEKGWTLTSAVLALAALTRPEGILVFALLELWSWSQGPWRLKTTMLRVLPFALIVGLHLSWRLSYYGELVPNTFYAKVSMSWEQWSWGLHYVWEAALFFGLPCLLLPLVDFRRVRDNRAWSTCLFVALAYSGYVAFVGGDFLPSFRFLLPIMPLWCAMAATACGTASRHLSARTLCIAFVAVVFMHTTAEIAFGPHWPDQAKRHRQFVETGTHLQSLLSTDRWLAVTSAGRLTYFSDRRAIDMLGLNDVHIAKQKVRPSAVSVVAHRKGDGGYVLDRRPAVILFLRTQFLDSSLAVDPDWRDEARRLAIGTSEKEIVRDPRFLEYEIRSLPLRAGGFLNAFIDPDQVPLWQRPEG